MILSLITLVLTILFFYLWIKKQKTIFVLLGILSSIMILCSTVLPRELALKESNSTVISSEQFNEVSSVSSVDVKVHESNKSYIKKTTYTVSKDSKFYYVTGYMEIDTKYDVYIKE